MKPERDYRVEAGGDLGSPREFSLEKLQPPEIVGQVGQPGARSGASSVVAGDRSRMRFLCPHASDDSGSDLWT